MGDQPQGKQSTCNDDRAANIEEREFQQHLHDIE